MGIIEINIDLLDSLHLQAITSERLRTNYDLRTSPNDGSQRMLNALEPGTKVPIHRHQDTSETIICMQGCLDVLVYNVVNVSEIYESKRIRLNPKEQKYGVQLPKGIWHSVEVFEKATIFEAKDGTFTPLGIEDIVVVK